MLTPHGYHFRERRRALWSWSQTTGCCSSKSLHFKCSCCTFSLWHVNPRIPVCGAEVDVDTLTLFCRLSRTKRQQLLGPLADSKMRLFLCTPRYYLAFDALLSSWKIFFLNSHLCEPCWVVMSWMFLALLSSFCFSAVFSVCKIIQAYMHDLTLM